MTANVKITDSDRALLDEIEVNPDILKAKVVCIDGDVERYSNNAYELARKGILPEKHININTLSLECREVDTSDHDRTYTTYVINALLESKSFPDSAVTKDILQNRFGQWGLTGAHIFAQKRALPDRFKTAEILSMTIDSRGNRPVADVLYESGELLSIPPEQLTNDVLSIRTKGKSIMEHYQEAGQYPKDIPEAIKWIAEATVSGEKDGLKERAAAQFFSNAFPDIGSKDIVDMYKNQAAASIKEQGNEKPSIFKER